MKQWRHNNHMLCLLKHKVSFLWPWLIRISSNSITSVLLSASSDGERDLFYVAITLFAISTLITWSYYGLRCWTYIFGLSALSKYSFKLIFLSFTIVGSSMNLGSVINFSDSMIFAMSLPNIIGLYFLSSGIKDDLKQIER